MVRHLLLRLEADRLTSVAVFGLLLANALGQRVYEGLGFEEPERGRLSETARLALFARPVEGAAAKSLHPPRLRRQMLTRREVSVQTPCRYGLVTSVIVKRRLVELSATCCALALVNYEFRWSQRASEPNLCFGSKQTL